ncbi:MAG: 50S ribosomal protein L24 [Candidatus Kerfeldbacteria bacterium]|nr:50S ribosomal protein L24 [Candidatus Kerfeldbacteria bacterium]
MNIKTGDTIKIIQGKDRGKQGKVIQVFGADNRIVVEGLNTLVKHLKTRKQGEKGQRVQFSAPLDASNAMLICPKCSKPTRVRHEVHDGKKTRVCQKCHVTIE